MTGYYVQIMEILEPKVGHVMAEAVLMKTCTKLGIAPENITADTLPAFADELSEPLTIYAGEKFAKTLIKMIKTISP